MEENRSKEYSNRDAVFYSFGQISLITAYQAFTFLVFTFYWAVVGLDVILISIGFLIWSIWNAFNGDCYICIDIEYMAISLGYSSSVGYCISYKNL